ncbi:MAG: replication-associated recombination protein A [Planctomycetes bacterium]|nr:replication-associated recombination protein A [Planctomycetota bacterium]
MPSLFDDDIPGESEPWRYDPAAPLADRMRPRTIEEYVGQQTILSQGSFLRRAIDSDTIGSIILWGPPGSGKTSLAAVIAHATRRFFVPFSAVTSGVKEVRLVIREARSRLRRKSVGTILFVDEIHRFNKAQQDAFLPHVESGAITLIGATTENPSFEVIGALLSRTKVFILERLLPGEVMTIVRRAIDTPDRGVAHLRPHVDDDAVEFIVAYSEGDARIALTTLEMAVTSALPAPDGSRRVALADVQSVLQKKTLLYDKSGEEHYNLISAFHKALRGSDTQAALYWMARMLESGEDPLYIARRMVRFASEDIGLADQRALQVALAARDAVHFIGLPEGDLALAQAAVYLAAAPKSNALYAAMGAVRRAIQDYAAAPVPLHIRNAPTRLMEQAGYGKGYAYDHDFEAHIAPQEYLPDALKGMKFYKPGDLGDEKEIHRRMEYWEKLRRDALRRSRRSDTGPE